MEHSISNQFLTVSVSDAGAELKSIRKVNDQVEYLWQLNKEIWERQAPLLFPIIGRLKDEQYEYDQETYSMQIHGFAYLSEFKVYSKKEDEITFLLTDSASTLNAYPFQFELYVTYKLDKNCIVKKHVIKNRTKGQMLFEIGGHEGFNLALLDNEMMEDYYIEFEDQDEIKTYTTDEDIMINKEKKPVKVPDCRLYLSPDVFKNDALIIDEFKTRKVTLKNIKNDRQVCVEFDDFKYLGIWTKPFRTNYVCIEPWSSLPDANFIDKSLKNKQDIISLNENEEKTLTYYMTIR